MLLNLLGNALKVRRLMFAYAASLADPCRSVHRDRLREACRAGRQAVPSFLTHNQRGHRRRRYWIRHDRGLHRPQALPPLRSGVSRALLYRDSSLADVDFALSTATPSLRELDSV